MQLITPEALAGRLEASAEQMFEAPSASEQSGSEHADPGLDDELDPTSIAARKAARSAAQTGTAGQNSNETRNAKPAGSTESAPGSQDRVPVAVKSNPAPPQKLDAAARESFAAATRSGSQIKAASTAAPAPAAPVAATPTVNSSAVVAPIAAETAKPAGESMARQVGRVLNSMRGGEGSVTRTATAAASNADARNPAATGKNTESPTARQSTQTQTQGETEKTDETRSSMFARLVRSIRLQGGPQVSSARIELEPPELGRMRIDVRVAGEEIRIGVRTESNEARDLLNERLASLRSALEQHGLRVERVEVLTDPEGLNRSNVSPDGSTDEPDADSNSAGQPETDAGQAQAETYGDAQVCVYSDSSERGTEGENESVESETWAAAETRLDVRV